MRAAIAVFSACLSIVAALVFAAGASAHAKVTEVQWDNPDHPTQVIATAIEDIQKVSGTYYLKVFSPGGQEVDLGNWTVLDSNRMQMTVSVKPDLAPGTYRIDWATVSADDGDPDSGSLNLELAAQATPTPVPATPTPAPATPTPESTTATPAPSSGTPRSTATQAPTAGRLPTSGGYPGADSSPWMTVLLLAAGVTIASGGSLVLISRRR